MLIVGCDEFLVSWAARRLEVEDFGKATAIGVMRNEKIIACAVFNNFKWPNIEISMVSDSPRWATKEVFTGIFRYPFIQLDCKRLTATTDALNQSARTFLSKIGFQQEGYHREASPKGDLVTYGMLRSECRWLRNTNEQKLTVRTVHA